MITITVLDSGNCRLISVAGNRILQKSVPAFYPCKGVVVRKVVDSLRQI